MDTQKTDEIWVEHRGTLAEYFEKLLEHSRQLERELAEARKQRDTLAEALERLEKTAGQSALWDDPVRHNARKALAAVKGGKP